ncbi:hypothetical protein F5B22DRAFT_254711 [Xylaria bambusicola]|uniref:uncharacterized protein n=1 Tax=Xylaria bambusicola TaxID=326684 RepID=UPI002008DE12|nr:uncharacterized protein F5B22DRAFT_254711 [Xylaria bambusicola]KAI0525801.1 hypothetical protein F5B22DRAFT_254711 [Xylaria bambusicola]
MSLPKNNPHRLQEKERPAYPTQLPPAFWDKLSEVPLTKNALRELERRTHRPGTQPLTAQCFNYCSPPERERIKRFARIGGPDLSDLRGYRYEPSIVLELGMSDSTQSHLGRRKRGSASALESPLMLPLTSTKKTSPYDRAFRQHLINHGIYPNRYKYPNGQAPLPPANMEEIIQVIARLRYLDAELVSEESDEFAPIHVRSFG